jgi:hypothetical protein
MLLGKNMNWSVYYDILALPGSSRRKVKGIEKF